MKKSISIQKIFLEAPFYERFRLVKEAGFDYAEFTSWPDKDTPKIIGLTHELGLKIASISGDKDYSVIIPEERQAFLDYLGQSIDVANKLGCKHIVIHSNAINEHGKVMATGEGLSDTVKITAAFRALCEAAPMAEKAGVTLVMEAVNTITMPGMYMYTTAQTGDLAKAVGSPNVKILYDTYHMQQMEGNIVRTLRKYADVLGYIHIGDVPERHEPGTGEINFDKLKEVLREIGYDGIFGFELDPGTTSENCARLLQAF